MRTRQCDALAGPISPRVRRLNLRCGCVSWVAEVTAGSGGRQEGAPRVAYTSTFCANLPARADGSTVPLQQFVVREVAPVEMQRHPDVDDADEATALVTDAAKVLAIAHLRGDPTFGDKLSAFLPPVRQPPLSASCALIRFDGQNLRSAMTRMTTVLTHDGHAHVHRERSTSRA